MKFAICITNTGYHDLEKWKIYRVLSDAKADKSVCLRVVDESGEDYLYPANRFVVVKFSEDVQRQLSLRKELVLNIISNINKKKFIRYIVVNFMFIFIILLTSTTLKVSPIYISIISIIIIVIQYPFILKYKSWIIKSLIYYISFLLFCFSMNFIDIFNKYDQLHNFEAFMGLLLRGGFFILFGHIYGAVFLPIMIGINWALKNHLT